MPENGLTYERVTVLNAARMILLEQSKYVAGTATPAEVRTATMAVVAEGAIFNYLNAAHSFTGAGLTYEQLHLSAKPEPPRAVEA